MTNPAEKIEVLPLQGKIWSLTTNDGRILTDKVTLVFSPTKIKASSLLGYETLTLKENSTFEFLMDLTKNHSPKYQVYVEDILTAFEQHKEAVYDEPCPHCDGEGECICENSCHHCGGSGYTSNASSFYSKKRVLLPKFGISLGRLNNIAKMAKQLGETHIVFDMIVKDQLFFFLTNMQDYKVLLAGLRENPEDVGISIPYKTL